MIRVAFFSTQDYDRKYFDNAIEQQEISIEYFEPALDERTVKLVENVQAICVFVNDKVDAFVVGALAQAGVKLVALRCAGYNNVDLEACERHGIAVVRVPEYSPNAVAEHTFGLILALNRKIHKAYARVRDGNFALSGLLGFDLNRKTIGLVGCGKIGECVARIAGGFGMKVLISDPYASAGVNRLGTVVSFENLIREADVVSLHCPLNSETYHLIDEVALGKMKNGVMLVNTSRGALVDTVALIRSLKSSRLGALAIDVYEEEAGIFFHDHSSVALADDTLARLLTFPNVLITGHQAFFTHEALLEIAETTVSSIQAIANNKPLKYQIAFANA